MGIEPIQLEPQTNALPLGNTDLILFLIEEKRN